MKTWIMFLCLLSGLWSFRLSSQSVNYIAMISVTNTYTVTLQPGITMNQYIDFMKNKYIPEYERNFPGSSMRVSGTNYPMGKNQYFASFYFESLEIKDKYYPNGSRMSDEAIYCWGKMSILSSERKKYLLESARVETQWLIALDEVVVK